MRKFLILTMLVSLIPAGARARIATNLAPASTSWEGTYTFDEAVRGTAGIGYEIVIYRKNQTLLADLNADGWQTSSRIKCSTKVEGNKIHLYVKGYDENDLTGKAYDVGSLLLTLERSTVSGKTRVLTYWGAFKPTLRANQVSGRVYFKRENKRSPPSEM